MNWNNPYESSQGIWLKGNLHTHTREGSSCGNMSLPAAIERYAELKYDFLCISNHMTLTEEKYLPGGNSLIFLPGVEWNSPDFGNHMTICSMQPAILRHSIKTSEYLDLLRYLSEHETLAVLNHPNWQDPPHYSREQLVERKLATGIEIYNALCEQLSGRALATEKWDYLLSQGWRLLGFAGDDAHDLNQIGQAWITARAAARTPGAILEALLTGNFYCSTGVTIHDIRRNNMCISVETEDADEIWAIGELGTRLARVSGKHMEFDLAAYKTAYVRFTAFGHGSAMAWTQPFFMETQHKEGQASPFVTRWWMSRLESYRLSQAPCATLDMPMDWKLIQADKNFQGFVNVFPYFGNQDGVVYLLNKFIVKDASDWLIGLGHDGGAKLFLDKQLVINQPLRKNPAVVDRSKVFVRLEQGTHEIVVVLDTACGLGQGVYLRFISVAGDASSKPRSTDFPRQVKI